MEENNSKKKTGLEIGGLLDGDLKVWIPFSEGVDFLIRHVPMDEMSEIVEKATTITWDRKHNQTSKLDAEKYNRLVGRAALRGWRGLLVHGEEFPFTQENADRVMLKFFDIAKFVNEASTDVRRLSEAARDELAKN